MNGGQCIICDNASIKVYYIDLDDLLSVHTEKQNCCVTVSALCILKLKCMKITSYILHIESMNRCNNVQCHCVDHLNVILNQHTLKLNVDIIFHSPSKCSISAFVTIFIDIPYASMHKLGMHMTQS